MAKTRNLVTLSGRLTDVPKTFGENAVQMRIAVDFAGNNQVNPDQKTGFFDIKYWLNNGSQNANFVRSQLDAGNFKKGTSIDIVGELRQDTWAGDGGVSTSRVTVVADVIDYSPINNSPNASAEKAAASSAVATAPSSF